MALKAILLALAFILAWPARSSAQQTPAWDFFAGYSMRRADIREFFRSTPIIYSSRDGYSNLNGVAVSVTENRNRWFGGTIDLSFHEDSSVSPGATAQLAPTSNRHRAYSVLYGPRFSYRTAWVTPFTHVLLGVAHATRSVTPVGPRASDTAFAAAVGGGVDVKIWDRISVRVVQAEYFRSSLLDLKANSYRASAGVVFKVGRR